MSPPKCILKYEPLILTEHNKFSDKTKNIAAESKELLCNPATDAAFAVPSLGFMPVECGENKFALSRLVHRASYSNISFFVGKKCLWSQTVHKLQIIAFEVLNSQSQFF